MKSEHSFVRRPLTRLSLAFATAFLLANSVSAQTTPPADAPPGAPPPGFTPPDGSGPPPGAPPIGSPGAPPPGSVLIPKPLAADAKKPSRAPKDFSGIYIGALGSMPLMALNASYTPRAAERAAIRRKIAEQNLAVETPSVDCRPYDNVFNVAQPVFPVLITQTDKRLVIIMEEGRGVWEIYLDRGHSAHIQPSWNGESVGHWEGDTLVVDITGYNGKQWMEAMGGPNGPDTHVVLHITKDVATGRLNFKVAVDDPEVYTKTRMETYALDWRPDMKIHEFECEDSVGVGSFPGIVPDPVNTSSQ